MDIRKLGNSNLEVSEISFGCMSLDVHSKSSIKLLRDAFENGINFFDTADLYDRGENEKLVGNALKSLRKDVIIATKVGNQWFKDSSGWDWNPTKEYILKAVEDSLVRLQTDYIDLYQLHGGTIEDPIDETIEAFEKLKKEGKIREYGISSIRPNVIREWVKKSNMASVMMQYSLLDRRPEEEVLDLLYKNNISVVTRGTIAKGLLAGKPPKNYLDYSESEIKTLQIALEKFDYPINTAIQFVLNKPAVASAVLGIRNQQQLHSILDTRNGAQSLNLSNHIREILPINYYSNHR